MSALQQLTRILLAAGGAPDADNKEGGSFIYADGNKLVGKVWDGKKWDPNQSLIATDASSTTPAVYLLQEDGSEKIFYISNSSTIRALKAEDGEWSADSSFPSIPVHAQSKLHGHFDTKGVASVVYQDPSGQIIQIDGAKSWAKTVVPIKATAGTPLSVSNNGSEDTTLAIFYISSADNFVHSILVDDLKTDKVVANIAFPEKLQRLLVTQSSARNLELYVLSEKHTIFQLTTIPGSEEKLTLGHADSEGKFVPGDSAENCGTCWYPQYYYCCRCGCAPCRCCYCPW